MITTILFFSIGYFCGAFPFGLWIAKWGGKGDITKIGSGNIGATNVLRTGSKKLALLTLLADMAKGIIAASMPVITYNGDIHLIAIAGLAAVIGHIAPIWTKFKGGKGIATLIGALIIASPIAAMVFSIIWITLALITRYASLASLTATLITPIISYIILKQYEVACMNTLAAIPIFIRHKDNISRLIQGRENKIILKSQRK